MVLRIGDWYNYPDWYDTHTVHLEDGERVIGYKSRTPHKKSAYVSWFDEQVSPTHRNRYPDRAYHCDF